MSFNLATMLRASAEHAPEKAMLIADQSTYTFAEVDEMSGRVAASLLGLGLESGDKVAVQLPNIPQFVFAYFGILKAGLTMVPLNPLLTAPEISYHLTDCEARVLITFESFAGPAGDGARQAGDVPVYVVAVSAAPLAEGVSRFETLTKSADSRDIVATSADDTAVLLYTSGTTGRPKGAELTHFQLYMNCTIAGQTFGVSDADVALGVLPLFHVFGLSGVLNMITRFATSLVLMARFEPAAVVSALERHRCTIFAGVPTMYIALLQEDVSRRDLGALRRAVSGGASMPGEVIRSFEEKFRGVVVLEGYGLSETASTTTFNTGIEDRKVLSIGKPIWGVEVKVIGPDGDELPTGAENVGEIVIRGHNVMKGYYNRPEETAKAIRAGWFHSGDLGYRDEDGYFFVVDRLKDLVIRGGYNVYPREVEEVLYEHSEVVEAAVVGKPDDRLGEEVVAFVALADGSSATPDSLTAYCKERLAAYKYPREIHVLDELPKGPTGKILKRELRV